MNIVKGEYEDVKCNEVRTFEVDLDGMIVELESLFLIFMFIKSFKDITFIDIIL